MENVYENVLDAGDFFDEMVLLNTDTKDWEHFLLGVAHYAAEDDPDSCNLHSRFTSFLEQHDYMDQIEGIIHDAMKAFVNERIDDTGANFDYI